MIYLAILWAVIGVVSTAWEHYRAGKDLTIGEVLISAVLGLLLPISIFQWTDIFKWADIVILKGRK